MSIPNPVPTGTAGLPRNAVRLAERASAAGWAVSTEPGAEQVTVHLAARVVSGRGTMSVELTCHWTADRSGAFRWSHAAETRDGNPVPVRSAWSEVGDLLARYAPALVDADKEADGLTHHGRSAAQWGADATAQHQGAARHADEVRDVHRRLQEAQAAGEAWANAALASVAALADRAAEAEEAARFLAGRAEQAGAGRARRAFDLAEDARTLAEVCEEAARQAVNTALGAEAEAQCAPYVAAQLAADEAEEAAWRSEHPAGTAEEFALSVIQAYEVPARRFAEWWEENGRPGMTYLQGWDAFRPGGNPRAELGAYGALEEDINRAVYALGAAAGALLRAGGDQAQQERALTLAEESRRGEELYAPGARRRSGEGYQVAVRVWSALVGRGWDAWLSLDVLRDFVVLDRWAAAGVVEEVRRVRRLLLVDHALRERQARHAAVHEQLEAERIARHRAGEEVYRAARQAGQDEESADWARRDFLARLAAEADGRAEDGRSRFSRDDQVWVRPAPGEDGAVRYAGSVVAYLGRGRFRVSGPVGLVAREVAAERLSPADADEAQHDRGRQAGEDTRRREERAAREAEEQERRERAQAEADAALARRLARRRAAAGTAAPVAEHGQWSPVHAVPRSVGELWSAAAEGGWQMTCRTATGGRMLVVRIAGTTGAGRWVFELIWLPERGQYAVKKQHGKARWADGRSGPRGGRIRPTVGDVLAVIAQETREGAEAQLGELVGGPGRPESSAPARV
ncbi:hypothetical protein ACGF12_30445 [Kitasatospora sp. NPDC048296]|uniref:hypothetical protein n=1 Tax=Kitasatospora sp. NPDC048296 TaxID=3364048 RepID=UPI003721A056